MSIIKKHDIVDDILICQENEDRIKELSKDRLRWEQMEEKDREELIKVYQSKCLKNENILFKCSYPFMKQTTIDSNEIFTATIGKNRTLKNMKRNTFIKLGDEEDKTFITLNIDLNKVYSFVNLKTKWLYFKLCKVEVEFRNNSKASFIPISCYYLPPCSDINDFNYSFVNNVKIASGTNIQHKSILNPLFIIRHIKDCNDKLDINSLDYYNDIITKTIPTSSLQDNLFVSNFDNSVIYLDYGKFIFTTNNLQNDQDILIKLNYSFKFYTHGNPEDYYDSGIIDDDSGNLDDS